MLKKIIASLIIFSALLGLGAAPALAVDCSSSGLSAQDALNCGANNGTHADTSKAASSIDSTLSKVINVMSGITAVLAVIMLILGGMRFVSSGGNQEAVAGAKKTIIFALVGLAIVAVAQVIVQFVLKKTV